MLFVQAPFWRPVVGLPVPPVRMTECWRLLGFCLVQHPWCWHRRVLAVGGRVLGETFRTRSSGLASFLADLSSRSLRRFHNLGPWGWAMFLCCSKSCFRDMQNPHTPENLGRFRGRKRAWTFLSDMPNPRRFLLPGFTVRFLPLSAGKYCHSLKRSSFGYSSTSFLVGLNSILAMKNLNASLVWYIYYNSDAET